MRDLESWNRVISRYFCRFSCIGLLSLVNCEGNLLEQSIEIPDGKVSAEINSKAEARSEAVHNQAVIPISEAMEPADSGATSANNEGSVATTDVVESANQDSGEDFDMEADPQQEELLVELPNTPPIDMPMERLTEEATYYVDAVGGDDASDGTTKATAWKSLAKVKATSLQPGDIVEFYGDFGSQLLLPNVHGTAEKPIVFRGAIDETTGAKPHMGGIIMSDATHLDFSDFDLSGDRMLVYLSVSSDADASIHYLRFFRINMHDARRGIQLTRDKVAWDKYFVKEEIPLHQVDDRISDISFYNSTIHNMTEDGVMLNDNTGNRFSYIGGSIGTTGTIKGMRLNKDGTKTPFAQHGVYASGGHGHLFDGIHFYDNKDGATISIRRGDITVRNCFFEGKTGLTLYNEDEGVEGAMNLGYYIYRNTFKLDGDAFYQGGDGDYGVPDPGNTIYIYNNTFIQNSPTSRGIAQGGRTSIVENFDSYIFNNLFVGLKIAQKAPINGHVHVISHNAFVDGGVASGTASLSDDPGLTGEFKVTSSAYVDAGVADIAPGLVLKPNIDYSGNAPDIGATER